MSRLFCFKKNANAQSSTASTSTLHSSLASELDKLDIAKERLKRYADEADILISDATLADTENDLRAKVISLREKGVSKALNNVKNSMNVDLCFVLDCTRSMKPHIAAAKDCILQVLNYIKNTNPNIKFRVGFCGYRDHNNYSFDRLHLLDFNDNHEPFVNYMNNNVQASSGSDNDPPEDVLGGLNAAITRMNWQGTTRVLFHICDYPPHGRRYSTLNDNYPDGDPNGLTAESVLEEMKSKNILYFFGKILKYTNKMLEIFRGIIGEFPVFDLVGGDPTKLVEKFIKATTSSITFAVSLTSTIGSNTKDIYALQQKKLDMNPNIPNWDDLSLQQGVVMWYFVPRHFHELKIPNYFNKTRLYSKSFSFKIAPQPFSAGVEKCAYFALDTKSTKLVKRQTSKWSSLFVFDQRMDNQSSKEMVIKEYLRTGRNDPFEKYLEAAEVSTIAYFLSREFNWIAKWKRIPKINFLIVKLLRSGTIDLRTRYYTIEPKLQNTAYKRFNTNTGVITEFRPALEAFVHFTYEYTDGYLVVCDLQGIELNNEFLLTDPAIHCTDPLRFGRTNFGERGINRCFLANHKCNDICKKLKLNELDYINNENEEPVVSSEI